MKRRRPSQNACAAPAIEPAMAAVLQPGATFEQSFTELREYRGTVTRVDRRPQPTWADVTWEEIGPGNPQTQRLRASDLAQRPEDGIALRPEDVTGPVADDDGARSESPAVGDLENQRGRLLQECMFSTGWQEAHDETFADRLARLQGASIERLRSELGAPQRAWDMAAAAATAEKAAAAAAQQAAGTAAAAARLAAKGPRVSQHAKKLAARQQKAAGAVQWKRNGKHTGFTARVSLVFRRHMEDSPTASVRRAEDSIVPTLVVGGQEIQFAEGLNPMPYMMAIRDKKVSWLRCVCRNPSLTPPFVWFL